MDVLGVAKFHDNLVVWNMKGKKHAQDVRTQPHLANLMITKKKKNSNPRPSENRKVQGSNCSTYSLLTAQVSRSAKIRSRRESISCSQRTRGAGRRAISDLLCCHQDLVHPFVSNQNTRLEQKQNIKLTTCPVSPDGREHSHLANPRPHVLDFNLGILWSCCVNSRQSVLPSHASVCPAELFPSPPHWTNRGQKERKKKRKEKQNSRKYKSVLAGNTSVFALMPFMAALKSPL